MKKSTKSFLLFVLASSMVASPVFAAKKSKKDKKNAVRVIQVARTPTNVPYGFLNEKGQSDGFEVSVFCLLKMPKPSLPFYCNRKRIVLLALVQYR